MGSASYKTRRLGAVKAILGEVVMLPMLSDPLIKYKDWCRSIFAILNIREKESTEWESLFITAKQLNSLCTPTKKRHPCTIHTYIYEINAPNMEAIMLENVIDEKKYNDIIGHEASFSCCLISELELKSEIYETTVILHEKKSRTQLYVGRPSSVKSKN